MKAFLVFVVLAFACLTVMAQAPQGINYQGVARDTEGKAVASKRLSVRISILKGSATGEVEYSEIHQVTTNQFGLFALLIGQGAAETGSFPFVSWAAGNKWLRIEMDIDGGNNFKVMGSQELMSVPYAFYSQYSGNGLKAGAGISITNGVVTNTGDGDNNPTGEAQTLTQTANVISLSAVNGVGGGSVTVNDDQTLTYAPATNALAISGGNTVTVTHTLNQVLTQSNDAGAKKITNLAAPTTITDATTKKYVDDADAALASLIATTYAFKTAFSYTNGSVLVENNRIIPFTAEEFDDFNVLSGNTFTAAAAGTYLFVVDGQYGAVSAGGQLSFLFNGTKYPITIVQPWGGLFPRFNATMMFKLAAGQTVSLVGDNILVGGQFTGGFYGYKL